MIVNVSKQNQQDDNDSHSQVILSRLKQHPPTLLSNHHITHHPTAGLNPLADSAGYLFSLLGALAQTKNYRQLAALHNELRQEIRLFEEQAQARGYHQEYIIVSRYLLCATLDDVISHTAWSSHEQWKRYSLLAAFNQDTNHQEKFFIIMERALKEPERYIDLIEIMYLCLSLGYKGRYRSTAQHQFQLEQIANNLYHYIRNQRGRFSKFLSPVPIKSLYKLNTIKQVQKFSLFFIFLVTASIIMTIFISLGYLTDILANETYKNLFSKETTAVQPEHAFTKQ